MQRRSIASTNRRRSALVSAASATAEERLIRGEQRIAHLGPVEYGGCRVIQSCHTAAQILDVVGLTLDGLTYDVVPATFELLCCRIQLSTKGVGQPGRDLNQGRTPRSRGDVWGITLRLKHRYHRDDSQLLLLQAQLHQAKGLGAKAANRPVQMRCQR
jgi:hypothetical protein